jgi:hypothetical protein
MQPTRWHHRRPHTPLALSHLLPVLVLVRGWLLSTLITTYGAFYRIDAIEETVTWTTSDKAFYVTQAGGVRTGLIRMPINRRLLAKCRRDTALLRHRPAPLSHTVSPAPAPRLRTPGHATGRPHRRRTPRGAHPPGQSPSSRYQAHHRAYSASGDGPGYRQAPWSSPASGQSGRWRQRPQQGVCRLRRWGDGLA